jgi:ADP-L-glycero-D-manno-heptose 6-epimerase
MYIITGGAGFIGSALVGMLNQGGVSDIIVVDDLGSTDRWKNLVGKTYLRYIHKDDLFSILSANELPSRVEGIVHMGAHSYTTTRDMDLLFRDNIEYSRRLAEYAIEKGIRFIYASSASVYGDGTLGFSDNDEKTALYRPLNPYGYSKQRFDIDVIRENWSSLIAGLRFFNVYGPNEYHKIGQFSVAYKAYLQAKQEGVVKLFKSYRPDFKDGQQTRDFVYVKDCCNVILWLLEHPEANGIFNVGYGKARSWNDLTESVFESLSKPKNIEYIDMPIELREHYQYVTEADISKLRAVGYERPMTSLEDGIKDYIQGYLGRAVSYI